MRWKFAWTAGLRVPSVALSGLLVAMPFGPAAGSQAADVRAALDGEVRTIFDGVAAEIRYEPYSGVLRGPEGTLASRAGNSADQALLLAALLEDAGIEHRFAFGAIDDETAAALLDSAVIDAETARADAEAAMTDPATPASVGDSLEVDGSAGAMRPSGTDTTEGSLWTWVDEQVTTDVDTISAALASAGIELADGFSDVPPVERERHVWVQAQTDDGWVDLDPTLAGVTLSPVTARETHPTIPEELYHRLQLVVVAETLEEGELRTRELVSVEGTAHEFSGQPILVANVDEASLPTLAQRFESVLATTTYRPVVVLGGVSYVGSPVVLDGDETGDQGLGGGFFGVDSSSVATAQWLELRMTAPDAEPKTIHRDVFDRIPAEAREQRSVRPEDVRPFELVDLGGEVGVVPAWLQSASWLAVETGLPTLTAPLLQLPPDDPSALSILPYGHHVLTEIAAHDVAFDHGIRPFVRGPNVTALTLEVAADEDGQTRAGTAFDIWHRDRGVLPIPGRDAELPPGVVPGVLAHVTERLLSGGGPEDQRPGDRGVGALFAIADREGIGLRVLDSAGAVDGLVMPEASRRELARSLDDGWVAVVPETPVHIDGVERVGWWLVEPTTGRVVDEMDDGRGVSAVADAVITITIGLPVLAFAVCWSYEAFAIAFDPPDLWRRLPTFADVLRAMGQWAANRAAECVGQ